jgi:cold shock CspA family protein
MKHTGMVSRLVEPRPFGFIKPDNSSHDFIFHAGDLHGIMIEELREGDAVEYELKGTDGYISSVNITRK